MGRSSLNSDRGVGFLEVMALVLLFAFGVFVFHGYCQEERITLTSYYPSPFGLYRNLNVTHTLNISAAAATNATTRTTGIVFQGPTGGGWIRGFNNELRIEVNFGTNSSIFIGAFNGSGLRIDDSGTFAVSGNLWSHSPQRGLGCYTMNYGSESGNTFCPPGFTVNSTLSGFTPLPDGGLFYCCNY